MSWLLLPFGAQGFAILVDEFLFHRRRGLPLWERIGHPIDTLSLLLCLAMPATLLYTPLRLRIYIALAILSCLSVTKDEWIHAGRCSGTEHWLHALLFVLHPLVLIAAGWIWRSSGNEGARVFLAIECIGIAVFLGYQVRSALENSASRDQ